MDIPTRLADLTKAHDDVAKRHACLLTALVRDQLGAAAETDPEFLETFLTNRCASPAVRMLVKAAVPPVSTDTIGPKVGLLAAFLAAVDRQSVLGQLGAVKVPPASVVSAQTGFVTSYWVGEAKPKPLSTLTFAALSILARKVVADVAVTAELLRVSSIDALAVVERAVVSAVAAALDVALLDPANAGIPNVKPPSLTNGLTPIVPAGDFQNQVGQVLNAISGGAPTRPVLIVSLQSALRMSALRDLAGIGVRVLVTPAAAGHLIAVDSDGVAVTDDGGDVKIGSPSLEMSNTPTDPAVEAIVMTSTWQANMKVVRGERWTNWAKRPDAVALLTLAAPTA